MKQYKNQKRFNNHIFKQTNTFVWVEHSKCHISFQTNKNENKIKKKTEKDRTRHSSNNIRFVWMPRDVIWLERAYLSKKKYNDKFL